MARLSYQPRAGSISTATLIALPVMLLLLGLVVYFALARASKTEAQNAADAAALAGAHALATDEYLLSDPVRTQTRLERARASARSLAHSNFAQGERLTLRDEDTDFGALVDPFGTFSPFNSVADEPQSPVNAVRVTVSGSPVRSPLGGRAPAEKLRARATAMLDFCVVGFRPLDGISVPLMPIGLFADHTGEHAKSWDTHVKFGRDKWAYLPEHGGFVEAERGDGIPEITVTIGSSGNTPSVPGVFLNLGLGLEEGSFGATVAQVRSGVTSEHCKKLGASFTLGDHNSISIPASAALPSGVGEESKKLLAELKDVAASGQPRIWQLFSSADDDNGTVEVTGWVGARLVSVELTESGAIRLVLQLAVVAHPAVVTEHARASRPLFWATNRTVCRVRLAD